MKKIDISLYTDGERQSFIDFIKKNPNSHIFHTIEWRDFIEQYFNIKSYYIIAKDNDDEIKGLLPLFYINNFLGKRLESLPLSIFGGFLGDKNIIKLLIKRSFSLANQLNCCIIIKQWPKISDYDLILKGAGLKSNQRRILQFIKIKNPDQSWKELKSSNRRTIRKAIKNEININKSRNSRDINEIFILELLTRRRIGVTLFPIDYYKKMFNSLFPRGETEFFYAEKDGVTIASIIILIYRDCIYYFLGAANAEGRLLGANSLIIWEILKWGYKKGYKIFNFGGTPLGSNGHIHKGFTGLYSFKKSFNTYDIPLTWYYYPNSIKNLDPVTNTNFNLRVGQVILKRMPLFIMKKNTLSITRYFI